MSCSYVEQPHFQQNHPLVLRNRTTTGWMTCSKIEVVTSTEKGQNLDSARERLNETKNPSIA
jgi:hypothetical protein